MAAIFRFSLKTTRQAEIERYTQLLFTREKPYKYARSFTLSGIDWKIRHDTPDTLKRSLPGICITIQTYTLRQPNHNPNIILN